MHTPLFIYGYGFAKFKWLCSVSAASSAQVNACSGPFECRVVLREVEDRAGGRGGSTLVQQAGSPRVSVVLTGPSPPSVLLWQKLRKPVSKGSLRNVFLLSASV